MDATANQTKRLQGCINDLISLLAFPAMWSGRAPAEIVGMLLDVLVRMLRLEFAYVRLNDRGGGLIEMARHAPPRHLADEPQAIGQRLNDSLGADPRKWPRLATNPFRDGNLSIAPLGCGRDGEIGVIVAGSARNDFPWETETVFLSVAANQASIGLQDAWRLTEQKQTANQLEKQVAERTEGLAAANEKLIKSEGALHKALDEIKKSEAKLRQVIDTIPTTAWTARPDGYCDFLNQVWLEYAGMTAEQAQGWGWAEAIHPDDREQLVEEWQSSLASGIPVDTEARIRRFDSSYRWFLIRGNPLRDESGNILKWYGTCTDIEDRKRWEQILRARELSWRQIVDNIPGLVATTGAMGEVEFLNRQTLEYFGRTNEELKDWALIEAVHPDDLPRVIETRKRSIEAGQIYDVEHRCRRADGVYRWFQVRGLPVRDAENKVTAWYLLLTDIDDRKKAEEALQASERNLSLMINAIPGMIHTARPDGSLDYFNRPWLEYLGCSLSDIDGWNWTAWIHPDDLQGIVDKWRACVASGENFEHETRVRRGDGQYRWMLHRKVPLRDEHGNIVRWYGTSLDIDDRKRAEAQVEQAYLRLAEAQRLSKTGSFITDLMADHHDWSEE